jgi:16S rRNA (uracil1498-N3)-methyltransferase
MHRFYLPPEQCGQPVLTLEEGEAHHALHVLRLRAGERAVVLDGAGHEFLCEVTEASRNALKLTVVQKNTTAPLPYRITLLQAIPKGKLMEAIVQKATELGVYRIVPLVSERVVSQLDSDSAESKTQKWQATAIEALKQSGCPWLPIIERPLAVKEYIGRQEKFDLPLIASLQGDSRHPRDWFRAFASERQRRPQSLCVWVGPEGDFTPAEMNAVRSGGGLPITLGRQILRTETAAIYCLSVLNYEMQSPALD